ncbi:MAG: FtsX-like permease family protein [Acidimicrobiales bacterium]|nr:FtsX-like permease family protein [Acidimicrobiales bacterium]
MTLGVGLFCGVLFFVDGLSASMTQRAVAPLAIDMQLVVTQPIGASLTMTQTSEPSGRLPTGGESSIVLEIANTGEVDAHDVTVRSVPVAELAFVPRSAELDGTPIAGIGDNPFAHGRAQTGFNLGTLAPGDSRRMSYRLTATGEVRVDESAVVSSYSSRENPIPVAANEPAVVDLRDLATTIRAVDGVAAASPLSIADLGVSRLTGAGITPPDPAKIFAFDDAYAARDNSIDIVDGTLSADGAVLSAEAAAALGLAPGDTVSVQLPDNSTIDLVVSGVADLSRARSLFSSRRGGDLETFVYTAHSVIVSPGTFTDVVQPAFDRAAAAGGGRIKAPPVREVDISLVRDRLDADPASARLETGRIGGDVVAAAGRSDYLLDNISNTLEVASGDADVAKQLFLFLGIPGGFLAAMLAAYSGSVLAEAQRREQAMLRVRGAARRHLLRMLALRTGALTAVGSALGLLCGYLLAAAILGQESLDRANPSSLATSAVLGTLGGFAATGMALYLTGRRSIDREINGDRARHTLSVPIWRRARLDLVGVAVVAIGTAIAVRAGAFEGAPGSVYFGRGVNLNVALLVLPLAVWITGSLLGARVIGAVLGRTQPRSTAAVGRPLPSLYRLSIGRRPWSISNGAFIVTLIVALATCLSAFTASYDAAKVRDARYANGADIRITPSPTSARAYSVDDTQAFQTTGVVDATPVVYELSNVILRSARTSDPANLAAVDPATYPSVAPLSGSRFTGGSAEDALRGLRDDPTAILVSEDTAAFLKAEVGDTLQVVLARATDAQVEVPLHITGLFERLPGFPDGADAVMAISAHTAAVPSKNPDFFLAATERDDTAGLRTAVESLRADAPSDAEFQIDTRVTALASDQSSLAALNIAGLVDLDSTFSLAMAVVTIAIFVFGLLLQRRREYITLRAQGLEPSTIRRLITLEAATVAVLGATAGVVVGVIMGSYFVAVLRPLFVLTPSYTVPVDGVAIAVGLVLLATLASTAAASRMVNRLEPTELLRDE